MSTQQSEVNMSSHFEVKFSSDNRRNGELVTDSGNLPTPLVVHSASISRYLNTKQIVATGTKALFCDPIQLAEELGERDLEQLPNMKQLLNWEGLLFATPGADEISKLAKPRGYKKDGVNFRLPSSGQLEKVTPQGAIDLQKKIGADVIGELYRNVDYYAPVDDLAAGVTTTNSWRLNEKDTLLPINGGGLKELHEESIAALNEQGLGYFITQVDQVDTTAEEERDLLSILALLPTDKLRVTKVKANLEQLKVALHSGIDIVYSDVAGHEAKMGNAIVEDGKRLNIDRAHFGSDYQPIEEGCQCPVCSSRVTRAYLYYLSKTHAPQIESLLLEHNLYWLNRYVGNFQLANNRSEN